MVQHEEKIICPECSNVENAVVEHTWPWWSYVHVCKNCNYTIMESEWEKAPIAQEEKKRGIGYDDLPF